MENQNKPIERIRVDGTAISCSIFESANGFDVSLQKGYSKDRGDTHVFKRLSLSERDLEAAIDALQRTLLKIEELKDSTSFDSKTRCKRCGRHTDESEFCSFNCIALDEKETEEFKAITRKLVEVDKDYLHDLCDTMGRAFENSL